VDRGLVRGCARVAGLETGCARHGVIGPGAPRPRGNGRSAKKAAPTGGLPSSSGAVSSSVSPLPLSFAEVSRRRRRAAGLQTREVS